MLNKYPQAIECLNKTLALDPNNVEAYSFKGNALIDSNQYSEAIDCFDKIIELNPNECSAFYDKEFCLEMIKNSKNRKNSFKAIFSCFSKKLY